MSSQRTPKPVRAYHLIALVLLAAFAAQCSWFIYSVPLTQLEADRVLHGVALLRSMSRSMSRSTSRSTLRPTLNSTPLSLPLDAEADASPLVPLLSVTGVAFQLRHQPLPLDAIWLDQHRWLIRAPFLLAGLALALSLWYIARRLYGTAAGHIALALFAFSPGMVARSSLAAPQIFAAWGAFGLIFTAIATAHTLYPPREVILWNWKRILLLGVSITFAVGAQWPLVWLLVPAAAFMLWAVPHRRSAALLVLLAAAILALLLLGGCYGADLRALAEGLAQAGWLSWTPLSPRLLEGILVRFFFNAAPATLLAFFFALAGWCASRRSRFFGNTAPLVVFVMLLAMSILFPQNGASAILFASLPFLLLFVAGVFADLIESRLQAPAIAFLFAVIAAQAAYSTVGLLRMYSRPLGL